MDELINNIIYILENDFEIKGQAGIERLRKALAQYMAAFGNCDICFGKGYLDMGERYCECERGKQLRGVVTILHRPSKHNRETEP